MTLPLLPITTIASSLARHLLITPNMSELPRQTLRFGKDITPDPKPLRTPKASSPRVLVIGGGVTGLITSWVLLDSGYHVTIVSKDWASWGKAQRLTSQIAGALWELPPGGCGPQAQHNFLGLCQRWALESYEVYSAMAAIPGLAEAVGIKVLPLDMFFTHPVEKDAKKHEKMLKIAKSAIRGFRHDPAIIQERKVNAEFGGGLRDAYEHQAPIIDSDQGMQWLMRLVKNKGAVLVTEAVHQDLLELESHLLEKYEADVIVNASGLSSRMLAADPTVFPVRGATLRLVNDGRDFPKVEHAAIVSTDTNKDGQFTDLVFMVPRNDNTMILGSIVQHHEEQLNLTVDSPEVQAILQRCQSFLPALKNARLDPEYPLAQGLRPFRVGNVRVERELRRTEMGSSRIVHSYGQGGAGWSLAFGCAAECASLVEDILLGLPAVRMGTTRSSLTSARL